MTINKEQKQAFEQWYAENAFDYVANPIGSRDCGLQRAAWNAGYEADAKSTAVDSQDLTIAYLAGRHDAKKSAVSEPVAWYIKEHGDVVDLEWDTQKPNTTLGDWKPLYTTPPAEAKREPLSDGRILHFVDTYVGGIASNYPLDNSHWIDFARAIEAAHGIGVKE